MTDISDDQVDELLREAEQRLKHDAKAPQAIVSVPKSTTVKPSNDSDAQQPSSKNLSVRVPTQLQTGNNASSKATAGPNWFDLPKTELTPQFKRDWQLLRMRGILDPKHQKKALRASAPEYSQVGEIIASPTEFYSARLSRKERKGTILEEVMSVHDGDKFKAKYAGIQKQKTSGKKGFYKRLVAQRRKRRN